MRWLVVLPLLAAAAGALEPEIAADRKLPAGRHRLRAPLRIVADGITLDLSDAILEGADESTQPDRFEGLGLIVDGRKNVTIRGGRLRGFRCAILVRNCSDVVIEGVDVSGNFRQRLKSTPEAEDPSDWLRPHDNDAQEWRRRYGAGICLENSVGCVVRDCTGRKQQNGLLLDRCTKCRVYDNDFSFNSGWGVALWRSSENVLSHNKCDWCVRGYSHEVYDRGQDSAGFLVFEQCHKNVFAHNSATHSGDGFFLFAGNETLKKTGKGGCNDNLVVENDFSYAVANAIEATFSRGNRFSHNKCNDSNYGIWAGYSYESIFVDNEIHGNRHGGIAIEHGMDHVIQGNDFVQNRYGIRLWWDDDKELLASKFAKTHPCLSSGYRIDLNTFRESEEVAMHFRDTSDVRARRNTFESSGRRGFVKQGECPDVYVGSVGDVDVLVHARIDVPGKQDAMLPADHPKGRRHILVDEWGPLDPRAHAVYPREVTAWGSCAFHVLGADGGFEIEDLPEGLSVEKKERGFRVLAEAGAAPGMKAFSFRVKIGADRFDLRGLLLHARWRVRHWAWTADPREDEAAWTKMLAAEPLHESVHGGLDFAWQDKAPAEGVAADRFATRAETKMTLEKGRYLLRTVSDDGVRVFMDGKKVLENWTWHGPTEDRAEIDLEAGEHTLVVEHFEIDGWAALSFDLRPLPAKK